MTKKILIPLPSYGFDPTEAAIPWKILSDKGYQTIFLTPDGKKAVADTKMLRGEHLGIWTTFLCARKDAVMAYEEMETHASYCTPLKYTDVQEQNFDALLLSGGHDKGVKEYLESTVLQKLVVDFFKVEKPVAAICHGVLLAARSIDPKTKKSVIYNFKTTSLLKSQELFAHMLTRLWLKDYYLTYPEISTEDEVKAFLSDENNYLKGPFPLFRDDANHLNRGFVVKDRNYLSARWPGDSYRFCFEFIKMIEDTLYINES